MKTLHGMASEYTRSKEFLKDHGPELDEWCVAHEIAYKAFIHGFIKSRDLCATKVATYRAILSLDDKLIKELMNVGESE